MNEDALSPDELKWLNKNSKIKESINEALEDSLNVNPLDSGEPDLGPYRKAIIAAHITIGAAQKKIIAGPYNEDHLQLIADHLKDFTSLIQKEKIFWELFSFHCACGKEEDEDRPKERIYMDALKEMIRMLEEGEFELMGSSNSQVTDLNSGSIQQIKGKGVNARFAN